MGDEKRREEKRGKDDVMIGDCQAVQMGDGIGGLNPELSHKNLRWVRRWCACRHHA